MSFWVGTAALICAAAAILGIPSLSPFALTGQSYALLIMAIALIFLLGAFDTLETDAIAAKDNLENR